MANQKRFLHVDDENPDAPDIKEDGSSHIDESKDESKDEGNPPRKGSDDGSADAPGDNATSKRGWTAATSEAPPAPTGFSPPMKKASRGGAESTALVALKPEQSTDRSVGSDELSELKSYIIQGRAAQIPLAEMRTTTVRDELDDEAADGALIDEPKTENGNEIAESRHVQQNTYRCRIKDLQQLDAPDRAEFAQGTLLRRFQLEYLRLEFRGDEDNLTCATAFDVLELIGTATWRFPAPKGLRTFGAKWSEFLFQFAKGSFSDNVEEVLMNSAMFLRMIESGHLGCLWAIKFGEGAAYEKFASHAVDLIHGLRGNAGFVLKDGSHEIVLPDKFMDAKATELAAEHAVLGKPRGTHRKATHIDFGFPRFEAVNASAEAALRALESYYDNTDHEGSATEDVLREALKTFLSRNVQYSTSAKHLKGLLATAIVDDIHNCTLFDVATCAEIFKRAHSSQNVTTEFWIIAEQEPTRAATARWLKEGVVLDGKNAKLIHRAESWYDVKEILISLSKSLSHADAERLVIVTERPTLAFDDEEEEDDEEENEEENEEEKEHGDEDGELRKHDATFHSVLHDIFGFDDVIPPYSSRPQSADPAVRRANAFFATFCHTSLVSEQKGVRTHIETPFAINSWLTSQEEASASSKRGVVECAPRTCAIGIEYNSVPFKKLTGKLNTVRTVSPVRSHIHPYEVEALDSAIQCAGALGVLHLIELLSFDSELLRAGGGRESRAEHILRVCLYSHIARSRTSEALYQRLSAEDHPATLAAGDLIASRKHFLVLANELRKYEALYLAELLTSGGSVLGTPLDFFWPIESKTPFIIALAARLTGELAEASSGKITTHVDRFSMNRLITEEISASELGSLSRAMKNAAARNDGDSNEEFQSIITTADYYCLRHENLRLCHNFAFVTEAAERHDELISDVLQCQSESIVSLVANVLPHLAVISAGSKEASKSEESSPLPPAVVLLTRISYNGVYKPTSKAGVPHAKQEVVLRSKKALKMLQAIRDDGDDDDDTAISFSAMINCVCSRGRFDPEAYHERFYADPDESATAALEQTDKLSIEQTEEVLFELLKPYSGFFVSLGNGLLEAESFCRESYGCSAEADDSAVDENTKKEFTRALNSCVELCRDRLSSESVEVVVVISDVSRLTIGILDAILENDAVRGVACPAFEGILRGTFGSRLRYESPDQQLQAIDVIRPDGFGATVLRFLVCSCSIVGVLQIYESLPPAIKDTIKARVAGTFAEALHFVQRLVDTERDMELAVEASDDDNNTEEDNEPERDQGGNPGVEDDGGSDGLEPIGCLIVRSSVTTGRSRDPREAGLRFWDGGTVVGQLDELVRAFEEMTLRDAPDARKRKLPKFHAIRFLCGYKRTDPVDAYVVARRRRDDNRYAVELKINGMGEHLKRFKRDVGGAMDIETGTDLLAVRTDCSDGSSVPMCLAFANTSRWTPIPGFLDRAVADKAEIISVDIVNAVLRGYLPSTFLQEDSWALNLQNPEVQVFCSMNGHAAFDFAIGKKLTRIYTVSDATSYRRHALDEATPMSDPPAVEFAGGSYESTAKLSMWQATIARYWATSFESRSRFQGLDRALFARSDIALEGLRVFDTARDAFSSSCERNGGPVNITPNGVNDIPFCGPLLDAAQRRMSARAELREEAEAVETAEKEISINALFDELDNLGYFELRTKFEHANEWLIEKTAEAMTNEEDETKTRTDMRHQVGQAIANAIKRERTEGAGRGGGEFVDSKAATHVMVLWNIHNAGVTFPVKGKAFAKMKPLLSRLLPGDVRASSPPGSLVRRIRARVEEIKATRNEHLSEMRYANLGPVGRRARIVDAYVQRASAPDWLERWRA